MSRNRYISKTVIFCSLCALIVFFIGFNYGAEISSKIQKEIISFLVTISAIIFGVMGAWLSITKIELQQGIESAQSNNTADNFMARARGLIKPITIASFVLIFSILFIFIQPILLSIELKIDTKYYLKSISFATISLMGYSVVYCLGCIIFQGAEFLLKLSTRNQELRAENRN